MTKETRYYDLDGTLSTLNNTFSFILGYFKEKNKLKYYAVKTYIAIIKRRRDLSKSKKRTILINKLFKNLKKTDLEEYFEQKYKNKFLNSLTLVGKEKLQKTEKKDILITGCTEIPAIKIKYLFGFEKIICTTFKYENGRIKGIKDDTFENLKIKYITKEPGEKTTYYVDDIENEPEMQKIMDLVINVK